MILLRVLQIMVWLDAAGGAGPISTSGSPVASPTIDGHVFNLFSGPNGDTTVYSFVAASPITSFSSDLLPFFKYLNQNEGFSLSQYLTVLEAGTEPFTGSNVVLTTTQYSVSVVNSTTTTTSKSTSTKSTSTKSTSTKSTSVKSTSTSTSGAATGTAAAYAQCGGEQVVLALAVLHADILMERVRMDWSNSLRCRIYLHCFEHL